MLIKGIIEEDFVNYYKPSMVIMMPNCDWKCGKELCQNSPLAHAFTKDIDPVELVMRYLNNPITEAIVFSGLEPLDDFDDMIDTIKIIHEYVDDDIIIYTGYEEEEILDKIKILKDNFSNIYMKFGRYKPRQLPHFDDILGVSLASSNQYGKKIC